MGFLSGVLGAVKNENEVETYDKHLEKKLNEVLEEVNNKIGSGRAGLVKSVDAVKRWLEGYGSVLSGSTVNIISELTNLQDDLSGKYYTQINASQELETQLRKWTEGLGEMEKHLTKTENDYVNMLDTTLKRDVMHEIRRIQSTVATYKESANNSFFKGQVKQVDEQLVKLRDSVITTIEHEGEEMKQTLHEELYTTSESVKNLENTKKQQIIAIKSMVEDAKAHLVKANGECKAAIGNSFYDVEKKLKQVNPTDVYAGAQDGKSKFQQGVEEINSTVTRLGERLNEYVHKLDKWVLTAKNIIDDVERKDLKSIFDEVNGNEASNKGLIEAAAGGVRNKADELHGHFAAKKEQFRRAIGVIDSASSKLGGYEDQVKENVPKGRLEDFENGKWNLKTHIDGVTRQITANVKTHIKTQILETIKGDVQDIKGHGNTHTGQGIDGIKKRFEMYALTYQRGKGTGKFSNIVQQWVGDILKENGVVKYWFKKYVPKIVLNPKHTTGSNEFSVEAIGKIAEEITKRLGVEIDRAGAEDGRVIRGTDIRSNMEYVRRVCNGFADKLGQRLDTDEGTAPGIVALAVQIAQDVETNVLQISSNTDHTTKLHLQLAVRALLTALQSKARQAAKELGSLLLTPEGSEYNIAAEIEKTHKNVSGLHGKLDKVSFNRGSGSDEIAKQVEAIDGHVAAENVKSQLKELITAAVKMGIEALNATIKGANEFTALSGTDKDVSHFENEAESTKLALEQHASTVTDALDNLCNTIREYARTVQMNFDNLKVEKIDNELMDIRSKLEALQANNIVNIAHGINGVLAIIGELEGIPGEVLIKKEAVDNVMDKLRDKIRDKLIDLTEVVSQADETLSAAIFTLKTKVRNARHTLMNAVTDLKTKLTKIVKDTFAQIISQVQSLFTEHKRAYLQALKNLVTRQTKGIERIIDENINSGIKGLMRKLNGEPHPRSGKKRDLLADLKMDLPQSTSVTKEHFGNLSTKFHTYFTNVHTYINSQIPTSPSPTSPPTDPASKLTKINSNFDQLLGHLKSNADKTRIHNYDHPFTEKLTSLKNATNDLSPSHFANPRHPELLDAVKKGLEGFVKEMGRVYVNGYDDGKPINWDTNKLVETKSDSENSDQKEKLTPYGEKLSKVFLTALAILERDIDNLKHSSLGGWNKHSIILSSKLGVFLKECGYIVCDSTAIQNGHLGRTVQGTRVGELCNHETNVSNPATQNVLKIYGRLNNKNNTVRLSDLLDVLYTMLVRYREVSHLRHIPGAKPPTTVNQMLHWFTGLYCNPVYGPLKGRLRKLLDDERKEQNIQDKNITATMPYGEYWTRGTANIGDFTQVFENVITRSPKILVTILGHGDADGRYGCDFFTNPDDLLYPASPDQCLDMLVDIALRLNHQIRFLYKMCHNGKQSSGWQECWYGKNIAGSAWNCNTYPCDEQDCDQKHKQMADQIGNQTSGQHPKCGIKSPLQSFLEDGLPGFLPHSFKKPGCKLECTVSNHRGIPCKTPMGFRDLSIIASHRRTGQNLRKVLDGFCGITNESLSLLCTYFLCLLRRPPQTLCDMFAFYHNFLEHWTGAYPNDQTVKKHKKEAFEKAVKDANFGIEDTTLDVASLQDGRDHGKHYSEQDKKHTGDLFSLICCEPGKPAKLPCGSYLQPLSLDIRCVFSETYASLYMSWIVYMTETFYSLLKELYEKCCNSCNKKGRRCYDRTCAEKCSVKYTSQTNFKELKDKHHDKDCGSIVHCRDTHATIFAAGFTFGSPFEMSGEKQAETKRTCQDFCAALEKVCSGKSALAELVHVKIPNFLWQIREKFFWTTVALWSASFLYLIYVMVGRLDLLHIKSHLRSPASHRITAQSLLAAARIGKLAKISYLQP